jgi:hypothetical protein
MDSEKVIICEMLRDQLDLEFEKAERRHEGVAKVPLLDNIR